MPQITTSAPRKIIEDFYQQVMRTADLEDPPLKQLIDFRTDIATDNKRSVWTVPLESLRFRLDNSRLNAETMTYKKSGTVLNVKNDDHQKMVGDWLNQTDTENMTKLMNDMRQNGQLEVAIITSDGFLINGNRRRKALELLYEDTHDARYNYMRVVVLPSGKNDKFGFGAKPNLIEIQEIEYACQVQATGKSEYSGINKALLYRNNINMGFSLDAQLKRDPQFSNLTDRQRTREANKINKEHIFPLDEVDQYLKYFNREGQYTSVSQDGNRAGRWQAFIDWSNFFHIYLKDDNKLHGLNLSKTDIPKIRRIAFKLIRQRELGDVVGKVHTYMRSLRKMVKENHIKKELYKLDDNKLVPIILPSNEQVDSDGQPLSIEELDKKWRGKYGHHIRNIATKCKRDLDFGDEANKPLDLLNIALAKLNHDQMHTEVSTRENNKCMELCGDISKRASELFKEFDRNRMRKKKLVEKFSKKKN